DYVRAIEQWVTGGATGARISKVEPADNHAEGRFALNVEFTADRYAQLMGNRLLVFKPAVVTRREALYLSEQTRKHPIVLEAGAFTETVRVKLPEGFAIDEIPDAVKLDTPFGTYSASYEIKDTQLLFTRALVQRAATIPAAQYNELRTFFGRIRGSEQAPVVLAKK
ncbi:MAG: hypothetical protein M3430_18865, partial [Acidobacteriota bacterium]|nr:hypothetical protein [Acidobacteriota bacterium]